MFFLIYAAKQFSLEMEEAEGVKDNNHLPAQNNNISPTQNQTSFKRKKMEMDSEQVGTSDLIQNPLKLMRVNASPLQLTNKINQVTSENATASVPATSLSNISVTNSFDKPLKPKNRKRKVGKLQRKTFKRITKERKRKRIKFLKNINPQSDFSTGYCSTALESMNFSDTTTSSSASGVEADVESLGRKTISDDEI